MRTFTTAAAAVALMTAVPAMAQQNQSTPQPAQQTQAQSGQQGQLSQQDAQFARKAFHGNMTEVRLGELAQDQAQSDQVKQFGQRMAEDHGKAQDKLKNILQQTKADMPKDLPQDAQQKVERLQQQKGEQFDRAFMQAMLQAHDTDLKLYRQYTENGQHEELRRYAETTTPTLEEHYKKAQDIAKDMGMQVQASARDGGQDRDKAQQQAMAQDEGTDVVVKQGAADVNVQQRSPDVKVVDPEPQVRVQTPEPQVSVDMPKPDVTIQQAEPNVEVQKQGQPDVTIVERDTQNATRTTNQQARTDTTDRSRDTDQSAAMSAQREGEDTALDVQRDEIDLQRQQTAQGDGSATPMRPDDQQQTAMVGGGMNLQDLMGSSVYGETGEQIGEVSDVLMSTDNEVERIVIDRGGFLGIGEKTIALDMQDIEITQDGIHVNMTDQQISELPEWTGPGN